MDEDVAIADIENKLMGDWATDDRSIIYNFFSAPDVEDFGQLDITRNNNFNTFAYKVFLKDDRLMLEVVDESTDTKNIYHISLVDGEQRQLKLIAESGKEMLFTKQ